jgi:2-hydroxychromene-2-carboxylate isomerase
MLDVTLFTDPACPFAFSAEPVRQRLRWDYGEQLRWRIVMIALTREPGEAERLAQGAPGLQRRHGMPIDRQPYSRPASSEPACRAVVAARLHASGYEQPLLRRLRVRTMDGGLLDDPALIAAAADDVGLSRSQVADWSADREVQQALEADIAEARNPSPAAQALDHKLGGPSGARRYSAPSYVIDGVAIPGFNAWETYETVIANRDPELHRRPAPNTVNEVMRWAPEPLATAEIALIMRIDIEAARAALAETARFTPAGADGYWHPGTRAP